MAVDFWNDASGQTAGTVVSVANSADSGVAFDAVGGTTIKYASDGHTGVGFEVDPNSSTASAYLVWGTSANDNELASHGFWYKPRAGNTLNRRITKYKSDSGSTVGGVLAGPVAYTLRAMIGSSGQVASASPALTVDEWYWVTIGFDNTSGDGQIEFLIYDSAGDLFHSWSHAWAAASGAVIREVQFMRPSSSTPNDAVFDMLQFQPGDADGLPVPVPVSDVTMMNLAARRRGIRLLA